MSGTPDSFVTSVPILAPIPNKRTLKVLGTKFIPTDSHLGSSGQTGRTDPMVLPQGMWVEHLIINKTLDRLSLEGLNYGEGYIQLVHKLTLELFI